MTTLEEVFLKCNLEQTGDNKEIEKAKKSAMYFSTTLKNRSGTFKASAPQEIRYD